MRDNTVPYTPQLRIVQCINHTTMETVRCIIHNAELPLSFWAEAVVTVVYLRNRSPPASVKDSTPDERWHKEKPGVSHLKVFVCNAFVHILDARSLISQFVVFLLAILPVVKDTNFITLKLKKC